MISRVLTVGLLAAIGALVGCGVDAPTDEATASDESELAQQNPQILGVMQGGDVKSDSVYMPPKPAAYAFHAKGGDKLTIDVRSQRADAVAYLTDDRFRVIAWNDDFQGSRNAHIDYTLPANVDVTSFRIVYSDYDGAPSHFDISLSIETLGISSSSGGSSGSSGAGVCNYGGHTYHVGERFQADDRCNTCTCTSQGIDCTKKICACNPDSEPDKIYMYPPQVCRETHVTCPAGMLSFSNDCGCGCRRP